MQTDSSEKLGNDVSRLILALNGLSVIMGRVVALAISSADGLVKE